MVTKTARFELRLDQAILDDIDDWRSTQHDLPSRAEAVRRLVQKSLSKTTVEQTSLTNSERLMTSLLCDLHKHLNVESDLDTKFIENTIFGGHYWGMDWKYPGLFHGHEDNPDTVSEVVDILDMWYFLEYAYSQLSDKDKEKIKQDAEPFGSDVQFRGFDGNNESEHIGIARYLINDLDSFTDFKNRELNAHMPCIGAYRRMLTAFKPIRTKMSAHGISATQLNSILKEQTHPENR